MAKGERTVNVLIAGEVPADAVENFTKWVWDLFLGPEIGRRLDNASLPEEYVARHATAEKHGVLKFPTVTLVVMEENEPDRVLFDGETEARFLIPPPAESDTMSLVPAEIADFKLPSVGPNASWILLVNNSGARRAWVDFRRNRALAEAHVSLATSWLTVAEEWLDRDMRVTAEALFVATEKLCKAYLLTMPGRWRAEKPNEILRKLDHGKLQESYGLLGQDKDGTKLYYQVAELRNTAGYFRRDFQHTRDELADFVGRAKALHERVICHVPEGIGQEPSLTGLAEPVLDDKSHTSSRSGSARKERP